MEHRLGRTLRVFLVVLASAGLYRLAVVPVVEPRVRDAAAALEMTPEEAAAIRARADRRMTAIGEVFAAGAWERDDPIVLESRQMRLLFKEYHSLPDGRVNLVPCTLVVFPDRSRPAGDASGGRTIVMRAPQGAVLEFDEPLDLRQGRLAKLVGGSLRGQVSIRGTPTGPDSDDDIEIVTRDVELDELEVRTGEMVQFRYGRSSGSGRALVARLRPRQAASDQGPNIAGVDSIRLDRDVRMRLEGLRGGLLPGAGAEPAPADPAAIAPPVLVSCRGSLCMNVAANVVTLEDHVDVVRTLPGGGTDQLACDLLAILLARPDGREDGTGGGLEPVEIQAKGVPVVVRSSAAALEARAARLGYEIATRRILLDGEEPVSLTVRGSEMEARKIDYCPGPPGDPGALMAVGPGWLRARSEDSPPTRARWQQWLRMRPDGAGHVVSIAGDAEVAVEGQGRMSGAEMHLWLDVVKDTATAPAAPAAGPDLSRIRPSRLLARGMVEAEAEQGTARTDRLEVWFRTVPTPAAPVAAANAQVAAAPAPDAAAPVAAPPAPRPAAPPAMPTRRAAAGNRVAATAGLVRGLVVLSGSGTHVEEMSMEGQVHLVEQVPPNAAAQGRGMEIRGDQLQLARPQQPDARAIVSGRPACVDGRDLHIEGPLVEFDRGRNHMTVDGAGRLTLPLAAGGGGFESFGFSAPAASPPAADAAPGRLDVTWQGRLDFDGLTARFVDTVDANAGTTLVACGSLDVAFDRAFDFGAPSAAGPPPQVARVACGSRVRVESRSESEEGPAVEQLFARDLVIDRRTGDVTGTGPGRLTSTRHGQVADMAPPTTGLPGGVAQPVSAPKRAAGLTYLGVDFQRGLRGNLNRRIVEFHQRVEAIHGPVARWGDTLDAHAAGGLPRDAVAISSDVLAVIQTAPPAGRRRGSIDLAAGGNVLVEGEAFTARSARLTWSEAKDLLVFEGDGRADAQLFRQVKAGAQPDAMASEKILYWRGLNRVDVEGVRYLELDKLPGGAGRGMPAGGGPPPGLTPRPIPGT